MSKVNDLGIEDLLAINTIRKADELDVSISNHFSVIPDDGRKRRPIDTIERKDPKKFEWDTELVSLRNHKHPSERSAVLWDPSKDDERVRKKPLYQDSEFRRGVKSTLDIKYEIDHFDYDQAVCGSALYSCVDGNCGGKGKMIDNHGYTIFCSNPKCMASENKN